MTASPPRTASWALASGTLVSRILGFLRVAILAQTIGITGSAGADMFGLANQLPNSIYALVAGGALNAVLVPQIVRAIQSSTDGGQAYINKLLTVSLTFLAAVTIAAVLAAPFIVAAYAQRDAAERTAAFSLAVAFAFWCLPQIFFYGVFTVIGEILNARGVFGPFAWAPVASNVVALIGLIAFAALFGVDVHRPADEWSAQQVALLAGSATAGVMAQSLILTAWWRRAGLTFTCDFRWRGHRFASLGRSSSWIALLVVLTQLAGLVQTNIALLAIGGSVAALQTAWLLFMLPHSVITVSISTAWFTRMSALADSGHLEKLRMIFYRVVDRSLVLVTGASVVLLVASFPLARVFAPTADDAARLAFVLIAYNLGGVGFCLSYLVQRAFYAHTETRAAFWLGALQLGAFCVLVAMAGVIAPREYLGAGIALASSISFWVQAVASVAALRRRWAGRIDGCRLAIALLKCAASGAVSMAAGLGVAVLLGSFSGGFAVSSVAAALVAVIAIALSVGVVFVVAIVATDRGVLRPNRHAERKRARP